MTRIPCPYCSQIVDAGAVACSTCGGLLTIGSHLAIKQALAADPTLSLKDPETVARLKEFVAQIDESISASERSKLEAGIQKERAEKEALRLQQEQVQAKQLEQEAKRKEYLDSLPSFKRFMVVQRIPIAFVLIALVVSALVIPNQLLKAQQNNEKNQIKQQQQASAAAGDEAAVLSAKEALPALEAKYCEIFLLAVEDPNFYPTIAKINGRVDKEDTIAVTYLLPLIELNDQYDLLTRNLNNSDIASLIVENVPEIDYSGIYVDEEWIGTQRLLCEAL
jgi:hypothetical protein